MSSPLNCAKGSNATVLNDVLAQNDQDQAPDTPKIGDNANNATVWTSGNSFDLAEPASALYHGIFPRGNVIARVWNNDASAKIASEKKDAINRVRSEFGAKRSLFIKYLRFLRDMGIEYKTGVTVKRISKPLVFSGTDCGDAKGSSDILLRNDHRSNLDQMLNGMSFPSEGPQRDLFDLAIPYFESGRELIDSKTGREEILSSPYTMHIDVYGCNIRVVLWSWFEETPFYVESFPVETMNEDEMYLLRDKIYNEVIDHHGSFDVKSAIAKLPLLTEREQQELGSLIVYRPNHPSIWSDSNIEESWRSWNALAEKFTIFISGRPFHSDVDREGSFGEPSRFILTQEKLDKLRGRAIEMNGFFEEIELDVIDKDDQLSLAKELRSGLDKNEFYVDKYGNWVQPRYGVRGPTGEPTFLGFFIFPAYNLAADPASVRAVTVGVDLTRFGFGDHPHLVTAMTLPPVKTPSAANPYFLYSTLPSSYDRSEVEGAYERAVKRAIDTEVFFGFRPGERINNIFFVPSDSKNASAQKASTSSLFIWDKLLKDVRDGKADNAVPHEIFHDLDFQFRFSLHPEFAGMFLALKRGGDVALFDEINEKNFSNGEEEGGHSYDNKEEFFASLVNSIWTPKWHEAVGRMPPRIRGLYYHALKCLKTTLFDRYPNAVSAPVFKTLNERISVLESMSVSDENKVIPYPEFEELAIKPVSRLLSEGPDPIPIIKAKDFEREVAHKKEVIVLIVFSDDDKSAQYIRKVKVALQDRARLLTMPLEEASLIKYEYFSDDPVDMKGLHIFSHGVAVAKEKKRRFGVFSEDDDDAVGRAANLFNHIDDFKHSPVPLVGPLIDILRR